MYKKHTKQKESRYIYIAMPIKKNSSDQVLPVDRYIWTRLKKTIRFVLLDDCFFKRSVI